MKQPYRRVLSVSIRSPYTHLPSPERQLCRRSHWALGFEWIRNNAVTRTWHCLRVAVEERWLVMPENTIPLTLQVLGRIEVILDWESTAECRFCVGTMEEVLSPRPKRLESRV